MQDATGNLIPCSQRHEIATDGSYMRVINDYGSYGVRTFKTTDRERIAQVQKRLDHWDRKFGS